MRSYHVYHRPAEADRASQLAAMAAFASQLGAPQKAKASGDGWRAQVTEWRDEPVRPTLIEDRPQGAEMLRRLADGDMLLVPTIADLADYPSNFDAALKAFVARGVQLFILELPGVSGSQAQPVVSAIADAFRPLEDARKHLAVELAAVQRNAEARLDVALQAGMTQMAARWGLPSSLRAGLPELGPVSEPAVPPEASMGAAITAARKAKGLTQAQLAQQLGISQPTLSRIEQTGEGDNLPVVLEALFTDGGIHATAP